MNKVLISVFAAATLSPFMSMVCAQEFASDFGVSLKGGTAGLGFDVTKAFNDKFKARAGYSIYQYKTTRTEADITYDAKLHLGGFNLLADYHPTGGGFRVTAGIYAPRHKINGDGEYNGVGSTININGHSYSSSDVGDVTADATWNGIRPYLGIGYDSFNKSKKGGLFFTADAGVIFSGSPTVNLNADCKDPLLCGQIASDIAAEENKLKKKIDFRYLPVVQIGVGYHF
jgi:hypothetical protein